MNSFQNIIDIRGKMEEKGKDTPIEFSANAGPTRTYSVYTGEALPSSFPQDSESSMCEE